MGFFFISCGGFQLFYFRLRRGRVEAFCSGAAVQVEFMDEAFADWAADDAAGDETEGSCGDGNSRAVFKAYFFQNRPPT